MARELFEANPSLEGVREETLRDGDIEISRIRIEREAAAKALGQPVGSYVTIELPEEAFFTEDTQERVVACLAQELTRIMASLPPDGEVLVLGLGNRFVTPDSLGPRTVDKVFVTRHIKTHVPEAAPEGMRAVSAIAPGVLGTTGVETVEIVRGLVENLRPAALLCIDALASRRTQRISASIQLNDTGVQPGAGVHNQRAGITKESMGLPVFAVGVPTVVDAVTIVGDAIKQMTNTADAEAKDDLNSLAEEGMSTELCNLIVTPKDIDAIIERASRRLADGINHALHALAYEEISALLQS